MKIYKNIHFMGIKGVGMAPLAIIAKQAGIRVTGSDVSQEFITDIELENNGIKVLEGFSSGNIKNPDLVIATGAHGGSENIEVITAMDKGIQVLNQGQALGKFMNGEIINKKFTGISVTGSHGKTTTSAILSTILKENNMDPTYVVGTGEIPSLGASGHFGKGKFFVTEADEYFADVVNDKKPKFLYQYPNIILITNLDYDHPDIFKNYEEMETNFLKFTNNLEENGVLVICGDGIKNKEFINKFKGKLITYGFSEDNDYILEKVNFDSEKMFFWVKSGNARLGQFSTGVFGDYNAKNSLGALVVSIELGLSIDQARKGLSVFRGVKRRAEYVGKIKSGGLLYDDYAHHPEEIKETLQAFKKSYPKHKFVVIFQPHMYSRTKVFFDDFVNSLEKSDEVIMSEIFPSFREQIDKDFSSKLIVDALKNKGCKSTYFSKNLDVLKYISSQNYSKDTIIITMGAGDIYKLGKGILNG